MNKSVSSIYPIKNSGFTVVELVIVITVLIILTSISAVGITVYLKDARDSERETKVMIIADALEKYYDKYGEYPTCATMRDSVSVAASTLGGLDEDVFKTPRGEAPTGLWCNNGSVFPTEDNDIFMYESPYGSPSNPNAPRTTYSILYWHEGDKYVAGPDSRRGW